MLSKVKLLVLAGAMLSPAAANATKVFNLNVTSASGTVTGSFTTNDARTAVESYNIVASAFGSFTGYTYTPATSTISASTLPSQYFRIDSPGLVNELQLYFSSGLSDTGGTILTSSSYEHEPSGGNRSLSGSVVAASVVPEASTWAMAMVGLGVVGGALRRRGKVSMRVGFA
ncbi:PEP-CTERM sorting domain-containing protein [Sphingomonas bacterium]|uniref:PEP-CTERM sorting domain-containing protein n=1 Tax=Sphingomonas bacterium TaxID=1895847 RepID=UPI00157537F3|nr:PEP-CTERM sorting domain-containing protein [Sphingomonas bacterium]